MAHAYYNHEWHTAIEDLSSLVSLECDPAVASPVPVASARAHFSQLYVRYVSVFRRLEQCYDQVVHPQKRRDIKVALDCVMARLCQVKAELHRFGVDGRRSDYVNLERLLLELRLPVEALELPVPRHFCDAELSGVADMVGSAEAAPAEVEQLPRAELLRQLADMERRQQQQQQPTSDPDAARRERMMRMTREHAARVVQRHERGRQGRVRGQLMRELQLDVARRSAKAQEKDPVQAAVMIQRVWRGHRARRETRAAADEELVFIGMAPPRRDRAFDPVGKAEKVRASRKTRQADNELKYAEALHDLERAVHHTEGPRMKDEMWDARYRWWIEWKERTGKYPEGFGEFYAAAAAVSDTDPEPTTSTTSTTTNNNDDDDDGESNTTTLSAPTHIVTHMREVVHRYQATWAARDEEGNFHQQHDERLARDSLRPLVREAIRRDVDEKLLVYLDNIKTQLSADKKKGKKKGKGSGAGKKKKKKGGKKKKKGGKNNKKGKKTDGQKACAGMSVDDMARELRQMGALRAPSPSWPELGAYRGGANLLGAAHEEQAGRGAADPSMAQVRQCVTEYCVLPLGSDYVRRHSPAVPALLLYGAQGSGKTLLSRAVARHTGALWVDLSPRVVRGHLGSKQDAARVAHMAFTVARRYAPAVVHVDEADRLFSRADPALARLRPYLLQGRQSLAPDERVLVLGNARAPHAPGVDRNDLAKCFGKMIHTPCASHAARLDLWRHFVREAGLEPRHLQPGVDLENLAFVSEGYPAGSIRDAVLATLPRHRVARLLAGGAGERVSAHELLGSLAKTPFCFREEMEATQKFTADVTGETKRAELKKAREEAAAAEAAEGGSDKKKKKKRK